MPGTASETGIVNSGGVGGVTAFEHLLVKYDGANGGAIYNIAGLIGEPQRRVIGSRKNTRNTTTILSVPDGGNAAILLGLGLAGMGLVCRKARWQV